MWLECFSFPAPFASGKASFFSIFSRTSWCRFDVLLRSLVRLFVCRLAVFQLQQKLPAPKKWNKILPFREPGETARQGSSSKHTWELASTHHHQHHHISLNSVRPKAGLLLMVRIREVRRPTVAVRRESLNLDAGRRCQCKAWHEWMKGASAACRTHGPK